MARQAMAARDNDEKRVLTASDPFRRLVRFPRMARRPHRATASIAARRAY
jgi:hypothetical protein